MLWFWNWIPTFQNTESHLLSISHASQIIGMSEQSWEWGKEKDRSHTGQWALQAMKQGLLQGRRADMKEHNHFNIICHFHNLAPFCPEDGSSMFLWNVGTIHKSSALWVPQILYEKQILACILRSLLKHSPSQNQISYFSFFDSIPSLKLICRFQFS